jgi:hypothetical protein
MATNENQAARVFVVSPIASDLVRIDRDGMTSQLYATALAIAQLAGGGGGGGGGVAFDTGTLANNATIDIGLTSAGHIYLVAAMDKNNTNVVGYWIVFGTAAINTFLATGCSLAISVNQMALTNLSGGPIDFIGTIVTLV